MGVCRYCGEKAGILRSAHDECERDHQHAIVRISTLLHGALLSDRPADSYVTPARELAAYGRLSSDEQRTALAAALTECAYDALSDHLLTEQEEKRLSDLHEALNVPVSLLDTDCYNRLAKAKMLRDLSHGIPPTNLQIEGSLPVILGAKERLIFVFTNVEYFEPRSRTQYVGRSSGVSVRVAKGLYFRTGASQGERIQTTELQHVDTGLFVITNVNLFFKGFHKGFKLPFKKLLSVEQFSDGIQLFKDGVSSKAQVLKVDDPWFAANVISYASEIR